MNRFISQQLVATGAKIGRFTPKHPAPMKTTFRNCFLVNFSMDPKTLQNALPKGLTPELYKGRAFLSVVVADLQAMRLGFLPRALGTDFTQVVYRAIVRSPDGERGVYFVRSDANSSWMSFAGNIFSNFNFNLSDVIWAGKQHLPLGGPTSLDQLSEEELNKPENVKWLPASQSTNSAISSKPAVPPQVHFMLEPWDNQEPAGIRASYDLSSASLRMPEYSLFAGQSVTAAQKYFVELYAAFASWPQSNKWSAVRIDRTFWSLVHVDHVPNRDVYEFMNYSSLFGPGSCKLDSCFYVHDLDYHWHAVQNYKLKE